MAQQRRSDTARCTHGLTLVELLVAVSLLSLVSATAVATFMGGMRVWERVQGQGRQDQWVHLAFHDIRRDVHNLRRFEPVPFTGEYDEFSAASMVPAPPPPPYARERMPEEELGRIAYFFDSGRRRLCRSHQIFRGLEHARVRDACQPVLEGVVRARFSYFGVDPDSHEPSWLTSWEAPQPPMAVKVEIRYHDAASKRQVDRTLIVSVPLHQVEQDDGAGGDT